MSSEAGLQNKEYPTVKQYWSRKGGCLITLEHSQLTEAQSKVGCRDLGRNASLLANNQVRRLESARKCGVAAV